MATVSLKGIRKSFGSVPVIRGVDLEINEGEFVVLIGPSGSGKSTLLRMIAGLETISGGTLLIDGREVNDVPPRERGISMVFQTYALYPHMTSAENMSFSLRLAHRPEAERRDKVAHASSVLGLKPYLDRYPRQLSGGQRQRVAMGRAIVREPSVFLFDEPLSNLDAKLRVKMRGEIKELHQKLKTTTIYVTHDQIEAMTLADRIVLLRDGQIEQVGSPLELYDRPANAFVGTFLGSPSMNIFDAAISGAEPDVVRLPGGETLTLPAASARTGEVALGIRPEHFRLVDDGGAGTLSAKVIVVEPTGSTTEVLMRKDRRDFTVIFRDRVGLRSGETVHLAPMLDHLHVFSPDTSFLEA